MSITRTLTSEEYLVTYSVGPGQLGVRLDAFLKECYRKRSRETLKKAIASGAITVKRNQGAHVTVGRLKPSLQLLPGDEVLVLSERKPEPEVCFDYKIVHQDGSLFVIDKPPNLPVHPAGRYFFNTLLTHLKTAGHKNPLRMDLEYYLVHRIDKETSGILVLCTDKEVATEVTRQFAERKTEKRYLAIAKGITPEEFTVDLGIKKHTSSLIGLKMMTGPESEGAQPALTRFKRLEVAGNYSLVECYPKTGRQHQIRVHLEAAGHPIVGDKLYGRTEEEALDYVNRRHLTPEAEAKLILPRHALHAAGIRFEHPLTGEMVEFSSDLPKDLREFLDQQKKLAISE